MEFYKIRAIALDDKNIEEQVNEIMEDEELLKDFIKTLSAGANVPVDLPDDYEDMFEEWLDENYDFSIDSYCSDTYPLYAVVMEKKSQINGDVLQF